MTKPPDTAAQSPSLLQPAPKRDRTGRRLNDVPILLVGGLGVVALTAAGYTFYVRAHPASGTGGSDQGRPSPASAASVLAGAPLYGDIQPAIYRPAVPPLEHHAPPPSKPESPPPVAPAASAPAASQPQPSEADIAAAQARQAAWQVYYQQLAQLRQTKFTEAQSALGADVALDKLGTGAPQAAAGQPQTAQAGTVTGQGIGADGGPSQGLGVDVHGQREKLAFASQQGDLSGASDVLHATIHDPPSPYTVMATTAIPAVMVGGANSDTPGMVIGQVTETVYDTATGTITLIPQGSRLQGVYDSVVSQGQERIGVVWTRIIFPDTSSIDIGGMEGADQGGYAGFHDQVNTHFWQKIGTAALISVAGAGAQLSQPAQPVYGTYSSTSIASAAIGQQFAQLGQEYARAGLSVPNTLEIRPGYRFTILVSKDIPLRPYVDRRDATIPASFGPVMQ